MSERLSNRCVQAGVCPGVYTPVFPNGLATYRSGGRSGGPCGCAGAHVAVAHPAWRPASLADACAPSVWASCAHSAVAALCSCWCGALSVFAPEERSSPFLVRLDNRCQDKFPDLGSVKCSCWGQQLRLLAPCRQAHSWCTTEVHTGSPVTGHQWGAGSSSAPSPQDDVVAGAIWQLVSPGSQPPRWVCSPC